MQRYIILLFPAIRLNWLLTSNNNISIMRNKNNLPISLLITNHLTKQIIYRSTLI